MRVYIYDSILGRYEVEGLSRPYIVLIESMPWVTSIIDRFNASTALYNDYGNTYRLVSLFVIYVIVTTYSNYNSNDIVYI